jgi:hypothetical protein
MGHIVTFGEGGYCADCSESHNHPLHNIVSEVYVEDTTPELNPREEILRKLGLSEEELKILLGSS